MYANAFVFTKVPDHSDFTIVVSGSECKALNRMVFVASERGVIADADALSQKIPSH